MSPIITFNLGISYHALANDDDDYDNDDDDVSEDAGNSRHTGSPIS